MSISLGLESLRFTVSLYFTIQLGVHCLGVLVFIKHAAVTSSFETFELSIAKATSPVFFVFISQVVKLVLLIPKERVLKKVFIKEVRSQQVLVNLLTKLLLDLRSKLLMHNGIFGV
jgi:hypothetical protein